MILHSKWVACLSVEHKTQVVGKRVVDIWWLIADHIYHYRLAHLSINDE